MKKVILLFAWFPLTFIFLLHNLLFLNRSNAVHEMTPVTIKAPQTDLAIAGSDFSGIGKVLAANIIAGDGRVYLLKDFLLGSPLYPYSHFIISEADRLGIDYRIVPAIAMCESNLGVRIPSGDSHNAWGIAVYTGQQHGAKFSNWEEGITWVSQYIGNKFLKNNIIDIKEIGAIWAPPSVEKGHSWANCVESYMRSIQ